MNDSFGRLQPFVFFGRLSELRTEQPDADAENFAASHQPNLGVGRGSAARFPESGHSKWLKTAKPKAAVWFDMLTKQSMINGSR
ncbi:MAG: hypothetical protein ABJX32_16590 [Tateyamaria sp.]|uniref:hypothetical protein n=1 Tax=Tateyamaria sp. TaxID=1929288 RepID=UPI0032A09041